MDLPRFGLCINDVISSRCEDWSIGARDTKMVAQISAGTVNHVSEEVQANSIALSISLLVNILNLYKISKNKLFKTLEDPLTVLGRIDKKVEFSVLIVVKKSAYIFLVLLKTVAQTDNLTEIPSMVFCSDIHLTGNNSLHFKRIFF